MNLAILHYHLNRGGVTRVVANQLLALDGVLDGEPDRGDPWRVALIYGGRREGWSDDLPEQLKAIRLSLHEVPLLDYDEVHGRQGPRLPGQLHRQLARVLQQTGFAPQETVLHVHNHALGKNRALAPAVARLAAEGHALLLEIHDFAEDFRPDNYRRICQGRPPKPWKTWPEVLYPQGPNVHYAVLNGRDYAILQAAGTPGDRLHLLPNPVTRIGPLPTRQQARKRLAELFQVGAGDRYALYPIRCIRRKNIGEALLLSALAPPGTVVGLTLAPLNPAELPTYQMWKQTAGQLRLPCLFEVGGPGRLRFPENLAAADLMLSTSLAEGFGMVFLEAWPVGLPLVGRDLPEVTADYAAAGVRFDSLFTRLCVPLEWVGAERFVRALARVYRRTLQAYDRREPLGINDAMEAKMAGGLVDFGDLDEPLQQQVIYAACRSHANRQRLFQCNPALAAMLSLDAEGAAETIRHNAEVVAERFSLAPAGRRLLEVYRRIAASGPGEPPQALSHPERILDRFLDPGRFRMIRA